MNPVHFDNKPFLVLVIHNVYTVVIFVQHLLLIPMWAKPSVGPG